MKKKYLLIITIIMICLITTACTGDITRGIRKAGFTLEGKQFKCSELITKDSQVALDANKISYLMDDKAVTKYGKLYDISYDKTFMSGENCQSSSFTHTVKGIYNNSIVRAENNKFYYLRKTDDKKAYSVVNNTDNVYPVLEAVMTVDVLKAIEVDSSKGIYYALKTDGNVYQVVYDRNAKKVLGIAPVYSRSKYGFDKIEDFNYAGENSATYIRSANNIIRMVKINKDVCEKYAGIDCEYEFKLDNELMQYKDYIIAFNGTNIITSYGKVFKVAD